ncbi:hypothetical protein [Aeromonas dhakensis]|uniref:hypothetical protein n=1 Tax=Aeromonas dhakensis TaxID=196024 RepID=UPI001117868A|nr:hypothetical protein [Aeromonas dhakensis]
MNAIVNFNKSAFFELLMSAVEAYTIKHKESQVIAVETYAHLWGKINKKLPLTCYVNHVSIETSAIRSRDSVITYTKSLEIKKEIADMFGEDYSYIGSMHTHPYVNGESIGVKSITSPECIRRNRLFHLSETDHKSEFGIFFDVGKNKFSFAAVMTLFSAKRATDRKDSYTCNDGTIELSIGNLKVWMFVQAFQHIEKRCLSDQQLKEAIKFNLDLSRYNDDDLIPVPIATECNGSDIMNWVLFKPFGRINIEDNSSEYIDKAISEKRTIYF